MKITNSLIALMAVFLAGCPSNPPRDNFVPQNCQVLNPVPCNDSGQPPHITINTQAHTVNPRAFCVDPGDTINFKIVFGPNPKMKNSVAIFPKDIDKSLFPAASNTIDAEKITVTAPGLTAPDAEDKYEYTVYFIDGTCVDPRISVRDGTR